ncbi:MAG: YjgN family protein, partial [Gammaproteobacteria bacterium]|nr:YjgN family protein [Gammaproteobacteria bacterium]
GGSLDNTEYPFKFTGNTTEFFGIWIVNVLLVMITFGIYSAWAKVRTNRYFYGHTVVNNSSFDYLANPLAILKGWAIAALIFIAYNAIISIYPVVGAFGGIAFLIALPFIAVLSMRFRMKNTSYHNIRFVFTGQFGQAFFIFTFLPLLTFGLPALLIAMLAPRFNENTATAEIIPVFITLLVSSAIIILGLLPYIIYSQKRYVVEFTQFGQTKFSYHGLIRTFYKISLLAGFILLTAMGIWIGLMVGVAGLMPGSEPTPQAAGLMFAFTLPVYIVYLLVYAYWTTAINNAVWNSAKLGEHEFRSSLSFLYMAWLYASNSLAIMFSFGLLVPWVKVRTARYRLSQLVLLPKGDVDEFIAQAQQETNAIGEEIGEVMDMDIGL